MISREDHVPKEHSDGSQEWYKNGNRHRDNDKPAIILNNGTQYWYKNGINQEGEIDASNIKG